MRTLLENVLHIWLSGEFDLFACSGSLFSGKIPNSNVFSMLKTFYIHIPSTLLSSKHLSQYSKALYPS